MQSQTVLTKSSHADMFRIRMHILGFILRISKASRKQLHSLRLFVMRRPRNAILVLAFLALLIAILVIAALSAGRTTYRSFKSLFHGKVHSQRLPQSEADKESILSLGDERWQSHEHFSIVSRMRSPGFTGKEQDEARIAYFVQIGPEAIVLLPRLISRIHHSDNVYILHVDSKVQERDRIFVESLVKDNNAYSRNIHLMPSEMLTYKGISMVLNTLGAITLAHQVDKNWDYFINLSGTDYPLLSSTTQRRLLARPRVQSGPLNFMSLFPKREWRLYNFRVRSQYWDPAIVGHQEQSSRLRRMKDMLLYPLEPFRRFAFVKAEAWLILSRPFCEFLIRSPFAKRMLVSHLHMLSAPEHYFIDVLHNHRVWRKTLVPDAFRKVVWYHQRRRSGQHPFTLDTGSHIFSFWLYLEKTRSLFARKISKPNSALLDRIDRELSGVMALADNEGREIGYSRNNQSFYARLVSHFDSLTQETLRMQNVQWPEYAYPPVSAE